MPSHPKDVTITLCKDRNHNGCCYEAGTEYTVDVYTARALQKDVLKCEPFSGCIYPEGGCCNVPSKGFRDAVVIAPGATVDVPVPEPEIGCPPSAVCYNYCGGCVFVEVGSEEDPANINTAFPILDGSAPELLPECHSLYLNGEPVTGIQMHNADPVNAAVVTLEWKC